MRTSALLAVLLAGSLAAAPAGATTIFSDTFDGEAQELNTSLDNWTVSDGTIDVIGVGGIYDFRPGNGNYIDLDGSSGNAGTITTISPFSFLAGTYTLSFELGGSTRGDSNTVVVALGSFFSETITLASNAPLSLVSRTITLNAASGSGTLSFAHAGGDNLGLLLDDVKLEYTAPTHDVPAPLALTLLLGGLAGTVLRKRSA